MRTVSSRCFLSRRILISGREFFTYVNLTIISNTGRTISFLKAAKLFNAGEYTWISSLQEDNLRL